MSRFAVTVGTADEREGDEFTVEAGSAEEAEWIGREACDYPGWVVLRVVPVSGPGVSEPEDES